MGRDVKGMVKLVLSLASGGDCQAEGRTSGTKSSRLLFQGPEGQGQEARVNELRKRSEVTG